MRKQLAIAAAAMLVLEGCSSGPREFTPSIEVAPASQAAFDGAYSECRQLYVAGKLDTNGRLASGGAGAAAGGAVGVIGTSAAVGAGLYAGAAVMAATLVLMPVVIVGGAIGMAKVKRHNKEVAIQRVMTGCLHDRGYAVASWRKAPRAKPTETAPITQ